MKPRFKVGDKFQLTADAIENYGTRYEGRVFTVARWFDHYRSARELYQQGVNDPHGHPGFDNAGDSSQCLYESDDLTFALYDWEIEAA